MATYNQYQFFLKLYDEQQSRSESFSKRCTILFSISSAYIGGLILFFGQSKSVLIEFIKIDKPINKYLLITSFSLFLFGYFSTALVLWLRRYEQIVNPNILIPDEKDNHVPLPPEDKFFEYVIRNIVLAVNENKRQNDIKALWFQLSLFFLFISFAIISILILISLIN